MAFNLVVNGQTYYIDVEPETPLLWVLRENLRLTGTKYGCGISECGACTVHINGQAKRSCVTPVGSVLGAQVTTIEGLSADGTHPVQLAMKELDAPQCGYCTPGWIMSVSALLNRVKKPTDAAINTSITNACRCGSLHRYRKAIHRAAELTSA